MTMDWKATEEARRDWMDGNSLYREEDEHSSCGVGLRRGDLPASRRRKVVQNGIDALKAVWHRGAVDADGKTGDGAGIHVQIPVPFFYDQVRRTGHEPDQYEADRRRPGVPAAHRLRRAGSAAGPSWRSEVLRMGHYIYGWRHVPVNTGVLGEKANATRPEIEQILIRCEKDIDQSQFERELYIIRRRIEKAAIAAQIAGLYLCSLSCRSIIYKGMMLAEQVAEFYPDLKDERFESAFAIYHQRYSTNTFPQWWLAQPFRMLAHNGEINTLKGNVNWMKSHEIRMASSAFGDMAEDIKPIMPAGTSDSGALDAVFEVLVRSGRSAPMAKTMLVPESWSKSTTDMPKAWADMYAYCNAVMEPWDGPAALAMTDGRWVCGGLDRNGLRPMRYVVTGDDLLIAGSEAGMVPVDETQRARKGRAWAGPDDRGRYGGRQALPRHRDQGPPGGQPALRRVDREGRRPERDACATCPSRCASPATSCAAARSPPASPWRSWSRCWPRWPRTARKPSPRWATTRRRRCCRSSTGRCSHFFRQNFSQVTNPPIDSLRERRVM